MKMQYTTKATPGRCACCAAAATMWLRKTAASGLVVSARACPEHEAEVDAALAATTPAALAATIPPAQRAARAASARRKAERLERRAGIVGAQAAALRGASSLSYTFALGAGVCEREAGALRALAAALEVA